MNGRNQQGNQQNQQGRQWRPNLTDELKNNLEKMREIFEEQNREMERLKKDSTKLVDCKLCDGTGKRKRADGEFLTDENNCPVPCTQCDGTGKRRI